jgi:hypothetical protein
MRSPRLLRLVREIEEPHQLPLRHEAPGLAHKEEELIVYE